METTVTCLLIRAYVLIKPIRFVKFPDIGILITATKDAMGHYTYNTTTVVLFTEVLKLLVATVLQLKE